ncbi:MAG: prepilin-type N-terminal cleavage/methylation domain-containing protein, partial [Planctomycetaceae bacterium]|nr:prepilin-type N-terminal cleavage/methylation domain-containing protein [Planctomycetaceae bacterium]
MNPLATSSKKIHPLRFVKRRSRQGLTLVELLIAVSLTLIIVAAMIRAFKSTGDSISLGRAKMDMHNKIRVVTETLRR